MSITASLRPYKSALDLSYKITNGLVLSFSNGRLPDTQMRQFNVTGLANYLELLFSLRTRMQSIVNDGSAYSLEDFGLVTRLIQKASELVYWVDDNAPLTYSELCVYNGLVNDIQCFRHLLNAYELEIKS